MDARAEKFKAIGWRKSRHEAIEAFLKKIICHPPSRKTRPRLFYERQAMRDEISENIGVKQHNYSDDGAERH